MIYVFAYLYKYILQQYFISDTDKTEENRTIGRSPYLFSLLSSRCEPARRGPPTSPDRRGGENLVARITVRVAAAVNLSFY